MTKSMKLLTDDEFKKLTKEDKIAYLNWMYPFGWTWEEE